MAKCAQDGDFPNKIEWWGNVCTLTGTPSIYIMCVCLPIHRPYYLSAGVVGAMKLKPHLIRHTRALSDNLVILPCLRWRCFDQLPVACLLADVCLSAEGTVVMRPRYKSLQLFFLEYQVPSSNYESLIYNTLATKDSLTYAVTHKSQAHYSV